MLVTGGTDTQATRRTYAVTALAGAAVHSVSAPGPDGQVAVVLGDGTRVRVWPTELAAVDASQVGQRGHATRS
jgi:hypothetical protein